MSALRRAVRWTVGGAALSSIALGAVFAGARWYSTPAQCAVCHTPVTPYQSLKLQTGTRFFFIIFFFFFVFFFFFSCLFGICFIYLFVDSFNFHVQVTFCCSIASARTSARSGHCSAPSQS
jgi:hypothetical protein